MKTKFIFVLNASLLLSGCAPASDPAPSREEKEATDAQNGPRLVSLIDYVAADYGGAVSGGAVISEYEYAEQLGFLETALSLVPRTSRSGDDQAALTARLEALRAAVRAKKDPGAVAALGRAAREDVVSRLGLTTTPRKRPGLKSAETLYAQSCATCHGVDGLGRTEVAASLSPRPTSFQDPSRRQALSPYRVYNALTLGVQNTAMPAFEVLSPGERWDLAFYVLRLAHAGEKETGPVSMTLADLAVRSDGEVLAALQASGHPSPREGLAFARREAAFAEAPLGLGVDQTRSMVRRAASLGATGRVAEADRVALDAYLQGFEPLEAQISAHDPNRTQSVEIAFRDFRAALVENNPALIQKQARLLDELLSRSVSRDAGGLPFVAAFIIYFREGVEAALLVGALLGGVRKLGRPEASRAIHAGWIWALVAGGISWFLFSRLIAIAPSQRELVEAVIGLVAALVLFSVSFWMISKAESRKWMAFLKGQMNRGLGSGRVWSFAGVAFLAVYRECAETILFTEALLIEAAGTPLPVFAGAVAGLAGVLLVAVVIRNAFQRLPLPVFFGASGFLLSLLAVAFAGSSISAFVAGGYLAPRPIAFPSFPMLGIHPDLSSLAVQGALVLVLTIAAMKTLRDSRLPDRG
ncbi:MAG: cytochrome c/FTR1 family iron permease [Vicinamibacteria bacterium]|nr:cytochrome c/FTR1 family iron permease [Vicinamibacteria bacterium]